MKPRHQSIIILTFAAIVVLAALSAAATAIPAKVIGIIDGDSLKTLIDGKRVEIRLYGVDAPETAQPGGAQATKAVRRLVAGHDITVQAMGRDRYGRTVAMVYAEGSEGRSVNEDMIRAGAAWVYTKYCTVAICAQWDQYQQAAKAAGSGLWRDAAPVPPWEWRHGGCKHCTAVFSSRSAAIAAGYVPCKVCRP